MKKRGLIAGMLICGMLATASPAMANGTYYDNGSWLNNEIVMDNGTPSDTIPMPITVHVDGKYLPTDVNATIRNGRTLMPLRAAGEALGCTINWDNDTQTASAYDPTSGNIVSLSIGGPNMFVAPFDEFEAYADDPTSPEALAYVVEHLQPLSTPAMNINGRTMLPLRAFAEAFETTVDWDQSLYDVSIDTPAANAAAPNTSAGMFADSRTYIEKYYVQSDPSDPFVGSWRKVNYSSQDLGGPTTTENFRFISHYGKGYQCISLSVSDAAGYTIDRIMISKEDAEKATMNEYTIYDYYNMLYYRGPNTGFIGGQINTYSVVNDLLYPVRSIFHIGDIYESVPLYDNSPYTRF